MPRMLEGLGPNATTILATLSPQLGQMMAAFQKAQLYNQLTQQQPFSQEAQDAVARQVYGQLASRGITEGGLANTAVATAFSQEDLARQELYLQQLQAAMGLLPGTSSGGGGPFGGGLLSFLPQLMQSFGGFGGAGGAGSFAAPLASEEAAIPGLVTSLPALGAL